MERLFDELADADAAGRQFYFDKHCIDPELRREVESLLDHDSASVTALLSPIAQLAAAALPALQPSAPRRCGPYQLIELIGSGGMGAVYRAERVDGEIRLQVAVKLMHAGSDNAIGQRRFLMERQILAGLQHPNIAGFLDAGHAEDGQPYFVLELVEGQRIDIFCEPLTARQKIELFLHVCDAVSFAHSRLIVHRDLKPGNILVTHDGVPKLLDFGIAKMLDLAGEDTITWARVMTPSYGSPEQMTGATVTTATDIYSLGAVLYRLLTGRLPSEKPAGLLSGDLNAVLQKALRPEPRERYATVDQFADDLRAYLHYRPVRARNAEFFYQTAKFARRHWAALTAALLTLAALSISLVITLHERKVAEHRFQTARTLAGNLFELDNRVRLLPGSTSARQYIADTALTYLNELSTEADERDLLLELGEAYTRTASVLSNRREASLGRDTDALAALESGRRLLERALAATPDDRATLRLLIRNRLDTLLILTDKDQHAELETLFSKLALLVRRLTGQSSTTDDLTLAATAMGSIRRALTTHHEMEKARPYADLTIQYSRRAAQSKQTPEARLQYATALRQYGTFLRYVGQSGAAESALQEAENTLTSLPETRQQQRELSAVLYYTGLVEGGTGRLGLDQPLSAQSALERSAALSRSLMAADPKDHNARIDFVQSTIQRAEYLRDVQPAAALKLYVEAASIMQAEPAGAFLRKEYLLRIASESTFALRKLGRHAEAWQTLSLARSRYFVPSSSIGPTSPEESLLRAEAEMDAAEGRIQKAAAAYRDLLRRVQASQDFRPNESLIDAQAVSRVQTRLFQLTEK